MDRRSYWRIKVPVVIVRIARAPLPIPDLRQVLAVPVDVLLVLEQLVAEGLFDVGRPRAESRHTIDGVGDKVEAIQFVQHDHIEGRRGGTFLLVTAHVQIFMIGAAIRELVDERRVAVEGEDDRPQRLSAAAGGAKNRKQNVGVPPPLRC